MPPSCRALAAAALLVGLHPLTALQAQQSTIAQEPVRLPNGREIRPTGRWLPLAPYPFAIALSRDGAQAAVPSVGFPFAMNIIQSPAQVSATVLRLPAGPRSAPEIETHAGAAYSPDGSRLYVATGDTGKIAIYSTADAKKQGEFALDGEMNGSNFTATFASTVILSASGEWLYALDQANWRVVIVRAKTGERVTSVGTGAYPYGLALSPDGRHLYVTNTGLFEYREVTGASTAAAATTGLHFPPFGYPSAAARTGAQAEGRSVPGLGDENSTRGSSLWTYTLEAEDRPELTAKLRLGPHIGERSHDAVGGGAPSGVAADESAVYVALAHQDAVVKISADGTRVLAQTALSPFADAHFKNLRGVMPSGIALAGGRLYVAESGINAVAVIDAAGMQVLEHIPVGWNPSAVALAPDGKTLYVVNTKGKGTGPNGGSAHDPTQPSYIGSLEYGSLSIIQLAGLPPPAQLTQTVIAANSAALAAQAALPRLKHCFLIIRENRTFDEVLGDVPGANGDPALARYGLDGWAGDRRQPEHLRVTPNLHGLAQRFAISDNFYVDSDVSADGHRWIMGIQPTPFFNTAWTSNYGGRRTSSADAQQPGRRAMFGGADAPMPEDEPQFGSLWEHVAGSGKGILNYGEGLELEGSDEIDDAEPEGQRLLLNAPLPRPVFESSDRHFPTFNLGIPDQVRAEEFVRDLRGRIARHRVPALIVIRLPNDHTSAPRPADGYASRASFVADNDLALGRIMDFLSHSSLWKDSAVFVTEDDAQSGVDHVDAHRSILLVASPWVRPGSIAHLHSSTGSITRTINTLLGLGPLNLEDALASELSEFFDAQPHLAPFVALPSDERVFDPARARSAHPRTKAEAAALRDMDDPSEIRPQVEHSAQH